MALKWYQLHSIPGKSQWQTAQLLPWSSLCLVGAAQCWTLCFCFSLPCFQHNYSGHWAEDGISGCAWWSSGLESSPWGSWFSSSLLDLRLAFLGLFSYLSWCAERIALSKCKCRNISKPEGREAAFRNEMGFLVVFSWVLSQDRFALFGHAGPSHCDTVWWQGQNAQLPLDHPLTLSFAARGTKERQWGEQQGASSALAFNLAMQKEQKERNDEVACCALWKGTSFSITHVCFVQSIRSPNMHSPISHLCHHRSA